MNSIRTSKMRETNKNKKNTENEILSLKEVKKICGEDFDEMIEQENSYFNYNKKTSIKSHEEKLEKLMEEQTNKENELSQNRNNEINQLNQNYNQQMRNLESNNRINLNSLIDKFNSELRNLQN